MGERLWQVAQVGAGTAENAGGAGLQGQIAEPGRCRHRGALRPGPVLPSDCALEEVAEDPGQQPRVRIEASLGGELDGRDQRLVLFLEPGPGLRFSSQFGAGDPVSRSDPTGRSATGCTGLGVIPIIGYLNGVFCGTIIGSGAYVQAVKGSFSSIAGTIYRIPGFIY